MYQNPFFTRRKPEFRGDSPSMSPADMTRDEGMFQRRQRYMARKNPLMAKPIRYDDPKGGYQQPGTRSGEVMRNTNPLAGNDSIRYSPANEMTPPEDMTRSMQSAVSTLQNSPGIQAILERRRQSRMA